MYTCAVSRIKTALQRVAVTICHNRINYLALIKASDTLETEFFDGLVGSFIRHKYFPLYKSNFSTCTLLGLSPAGGRAPRQLSARPSPPFRAPVCLHGAAPCGAATVLFSLPFWALNALLPLLHQLLSVSVLQSFTSSNCSSKSRM